MKRLALLTSTALLFAACGGDSTATPTATPPVATTAATSSPPATPPAGATPAATATVAGDLPVCLQAERYASDGDIVVAGATGGALERGQVLDVRWNAHAGCERVVIDLGMADGSAAAAPGMVAASLLRDLGVVRVRLPDVESVDPDATERMTGGELASAAYVVRSRDGGLYVDLHLGGSAEVAVTTLADPARVVVDLRPGGSAIPAPAASTIRVVMLTPRPGAATYPLTVTGYARTFEANVVARLVQGGDLVVEDHTTATAWTDAWGEFSITFADGPAGAVEVQAGEYSARDGAWEGTAVAVELP